jgi:hypothetical protein
VEQGGGNDAKWAETLDETDQIGPENLIQNILVFPPNKINFVQHQLKTMFLCKLLQMLPDISSSAMRCKNAHHLKLWP